MIDSDLAEIEEEEDIPLSGDFTRAEWGRRTIQQYLARASSISREKEKAEACVRELIKLFERMRVRNHSSHKKLRSYGEEEEYSAARVTIKLNLEYFETQVKETIKKFKKKFKVFMREADPRREFKFESIVNALHFEALIEDPDWKKEFNEFYERENIQQTLDTAYLFYAGSKVIMPKGLNANTQITYILSALNELEAAINLSERPPELQYKISLAAQKVISWGKIGKAIQDSDLKKRHLHHQNDLVKSYLEEWIATSRESHEE